MIKFIIITLTHALQTGIHYDGFINCGNIKTYSQKIKFEEPFINIPQVVVSQQRYDQYPGAQTYITTSDITNTCLNIFNIEFNIVLQCDGSVTYSIAIEWIAIDDNKFEFLTSYNNDVTNLDTKIFTLPHSDINHIQAFVGLIYFWFLGDINFNLIVFFLSKQIQEINPTSVTVSFVQTLSNVHNIGFFIILGTADAFTIANQRVNSNINSYNNQIYTFPLQLQLNSKLFVVFQGIHYLQPAPTNINSADNFRLYQWQKIKNDATVQNKLETWYYTQIEQVTVQEVIFETNQVIHKPTLFYQKLRCAKKYQPNQDQKQIKVKIFEQIITSNDKVQIDGTIQTFTIVISFQCQLGTFLSVNFLKCFECDFPYFQYQQQCYDGINLIELSVTLHQELQIQSKLQIEINNDQLILSSLVPNIIGDVPYETIITSLNEV